MFFNKDIFLQILIGLKFFVILRPEKRLSRAYLRVRKVGTAQSDILPNGKPLETEEESATENNRLKR